MALAKMMTNNERATPFPTKKQCWRTSPHGRGVRTFSEMLIAIAEYAKHDRAEFVRVVQEAQSSQQTAEVKKQRTRLAAAKQRVSELEVLLCKIYLGHYGRLRKAYLEMHRPILFNELVLSDRLFEHCTEIDEAARNRMELIVRSLAKQYGVTEQLKAENQMEWVRQMNACKAQAEEIVKAELIYD